MNSNDEQSIPSRGSHGSPVAWALMQPDSYSVFASRMLAEKMQELCAGGEIVPLYSQPQPTLTDAELEALLFCYRAALPEAEKLGGNAGELCRMHRYTLRGLLKRLG